MSGANKSHSFTYEVDRDTHEDDLSEKQEECSRHVEVQPWQRVG